MTERHVPHAVPLITRTERLSGKRESQHVAGSRELQHMAVTGVVTWIPMATCITSTQSNYNYIGYVKILRRTNSLHKDAKHYPHL
jgi:hypothetical protein